MADNCYVAQSSHLHSLFGKPVLLTYSNLIFAKWLSLILRHVYFFCCHLILKFVFELIVSIRHFASILLFI